MKKDIKYEDIKKDSDTTIFCQEMKNGKHCLTIEQNGNKVYLQKQHLNILPRLAKRWLR